MHPIDKGSGEREVEGHFEMQTSFRAVKLTDSYNELKT
jgi:hypothetical protein